MAGRQSTPQRTPFWFSSSKMKFLFIIHKPENLCNSSGKAVSFKVSLCSDVSLSRAASWVLWEAVSGPACNGT